jgi:putative toxin-antitoxin system antitoxin component (TIGR02293 family)
MVTSDSHNVAQQHRYLLEFVGSTSVCQAMRQNARQLHECKSGGPLLSQLLERLDDLTREFDLDQTQVASVLGANPRTVSRWLRSETSPSREARERLLEFLAVLERLSAVLQPSAAHDWLFTPNGALGNEKPASLLREGQYREVLAAVDALAEGVFQ